MSACTYFSIVVDTLFLQYTFYRESKESKVAKA